LAAERPSFPVDYLLPGRAMDDSAAFKIRAEDLWFMHLRHTAVTRLAEAECEIPLISAVTGHSPASVQQILSRYLVRTRQFARLAFQCRLAADGSGYAGDAQERGQ
jgi:integrase